MLKNTTKVLLQKILGYENYLFIFSIFTISRLKNNRHEKEFADFVNKIPNEGVILDIGANIGSMTVTLAKRLNNARIFAFEPIPSNINNIKRVIEYYHLKNVTIFEMALGEESGELKMVVPVIKNMKMQGLSHVVVPGDTSEWNTGENFSVPVRKLDDIAELHSIPKINAIKIDVENFEYYVLKGAENLLRRHKPKIYCELWANELRTKTLNYLKSLGYSVFVYLEDKWAPYTNQNETNFYLE